MKSSAVVTTALLSVLGQAANTPDYTTSPAGNPFVEGWYADPDNEFYNGEYWVYTTYSHGYDEQTFLDAFSSPDLVNWTKHPNILNTTSFPWAKRAVWAPAPISRNGKYYLYFAANDIQTNNEYGGIGVGVADRPEGPYLDPIGGPLVGKYYNGAQPIDQDVFIDDDGQAYIYYGGHGHANIARLNEDMISVGTFPDGDQYKEITPQNYVEGPQMFKRNGKYYLFWSEGGWTGPDYAVSYAISDNPVGPWKRIEKILQQDLAIATGSGHNGVITVPGTDIHYIVYHRHPLGSTDGNDRHLCYDRLIFREDGTIEPIVMGVKDNFADGNMIGWSTHGGNWDVTTGHLKAGFSYGSKAALNTNFANQFYSADVTIPSEGNGDAGLIFRATGIGAGTDEYHGYYLGISTSGKIVLGKAANNWKVIKIIQARIRAGNTYRVSVHAVGSQINCRVRQKSDSDVIFSVRDDTFKSGANGVRAYATEATFDNIDVQHV